MKSFASNSMFTGAITVFAVIPMSTTIGGIGVGVTVGVGSSVAHAIETNAVDNAKPTTQIARGLGIANFMVCYTETGTIAD